MKTRFLAAASHDLRQPVQSLVLMTGVLASRLLDHPAAALVNSLQASVDALCRMLKALLDVSKLDAGTVPVNMQTVQLSKIFLDLEAEYQLRAAEQGLTLRTVSSSLTLRADPALLERIIRNLLENALRYTDQGRILLGCRRRSGKVLIQVHDTGVGIPAEHLGRIFQEFYQVSNPARDRSKGLGLGLAIVDRLARLLGYGVSVSSRPGKGTCFTIEAVLSIDATKESAPAEIVAEPSQAVPAGLAVVIDDDLLVREGLKVLIEQTGWRVLSADSTTSALRQLASCPEKPTLVIADYRLEGDATGIEALHSIEAQVGAPMLSVVLTGDTAPERIADVQASGYRILHKPLPTQELMSLLAEVSGLRSPGPVHGAARPCSARHGSVGAGPGSSACR
jgi:CheY-like chemotaxis protein/anti-sigma regulatory factor (Ser/Thr protein kinase)